MDVKEAIKRRYSVRAYSDKDVPRELVNELIEAAELAPSGNNAKPWHFVVVRSEEQKKLLRENGIFKQDFVYSAPVIIVCCADPSAYTKNVSGFDDDNKTRAIRDLSISSAFLVLRATELGLGTCYIGWVKKEKIKQVLEIEKGYAVPYVITVGYANKAS